MAMQDFKTALQERAIIKDVATLSTLTVPDNDSKDILFSARIKVFAEKVQKNRCFSNMTRAFVHMTWDGKTALL